MAEDRPVAIAAIVATAAVGIIGTFTGFITACEERNNGRGVAREERENARGIAHDARVYDRRADTYLTALRLVERQRRQIISEEDRLENAMQADDPVKAVLRGHPRLLMSLDHDSYLFARITAFGTPKVIKGYTQLEAASSEIQGEEDDLFATAKIKPRTIQGALASLLPELRIQEAEFSATEAKFESLVHHDLS